LWKSNVTCCMPWELRIQRKQAWQWVSFGWCNTLFTLDWVRFRWFQEFAWELIVYYSLRSRIEWLLRRHALKRIAVLDGSSYASCRKHSAAGRVVFVADAVGSAVDWLHNAACIPFSLMALSNYTSIECLVWLVVWHRNDLSVLIEWWFLSALGRYLHGASTFNTLSYNSDHP